MSGWIKLNRNILEWEWYDDINTSRLFIHLLLQTNHSDKKWHGIPIKRGQCLTGRKKLSKQTNLSEQQVRSALKKLESTNNITIKATKLHSIITVVNYDEYQSCQQLDNQDSNQQNNQDATKEQPSDNQVITTTKKVNKDNKVKNEKKKYGEFENVSLTDVEYQKLIDKFGETSTVDQIENLSLYIKSRGNKYKSHYATILTWYRNNNKETKPTKPKGNGTIWWPLIDFYIVKDALPHSEYLALQSRPDLKEKLNDDIAGGFKQTKQSVIDWWDRNGTKDCSDMIADVVGNAFGNMTKPIIVDEL